MEYLWFDGTADFVTQLGIAVSAVGVGISFINRAPQRWLGPVVIERSGRHRGTDSAKALEQRRIGWSWIGDGVTAFGLLVAIAAAVAG